MSARNIVIGDDYIVKPAHQHTTIETQPFVNNTSPDYIHDPTIGVSTE